MTATHCGGIPAWKQNRPGMVRRVGPAAISVHDLVKHGTDGTYGVWLLLFTQRKEAYPMTKNPWERSQDGCPTACTTRRGDRGITGRVYRSTVFWTPLDLKLGGLSQGTSLLQSHLGRGFVAMLANQPGRIVLTLKLVECQAELFHGLKGLEP